MSNYIKKEDIERLQKLKERLEEKGKSRIVAEIDKKLDSEIVEK